MIKSAVYQQMQHLWFVVCACLRATLLKEGAFYLKECVCYDSLDLMLVQYLQPNRSEKFYLGPT